MLVMFRLIGIITTGYLVLNFPMALQEMVVAGWRPIAKQTRGISCVCYLRLRSLDKLLGMELELALGIAPGQSSRRNRDTCLMTGRPLPGKIQPITKQMEKSTCLE
jgi:hypothetical protein